MTARAYTQNRTVEGIDVGADGIAHLHSIGRWLQEVAVADAMDAGMARETAWILRRTSVSSERLPRFGERLELVSRCTGMAKSVAERTTTITGDAGASLKTVAIWVHLDPELRRPARLPPEFLTAYAESAGDSRPRSSLRHPAEPPAEAEVIGWHFARADIDYAGHVNNTMYWRVAEDLLGVERLTASPATLEAEYRGGLGAGEARVHRLGDSLWVCGEEGVVAATIVVDAAARSRTIA